MPIAPGILADLQNAVASSLPDTATVARTGAQVPCRVNAERATMGLQDLPELMLVPRWRITCAAITDIRRSDLLTIPGKGTFFLADVPTQASYPVSTLGHALMVGTTSTASTKREPPVQPIGTSATWQTHIASLTLWSPLDLILTPISPRDMSDVWDVTVVAAGKIYAAWPLGGTFAPPITAPSLAGSPTGGTLAAATYTYQVTNVTVTGETTIGPTSSPVVTTGSASSIALSAIPLGPGGTTARKIYRSAGSGYGLVQTLSGNTATTWTDTGATASTGPPVSNTATEDAPIQIKDTITIGGISYVIHGVKNYAGAYCVLWVEIPTG